MNTSDVTDLPQTPAASTPASGSAQERVYPFHCGSQIMDWKLNNCEKCKKGYDEKASKWLCKLEEGMDGCYMGDGSYPPELAKQIGTPDDCMVYLWRCPEFVPNEKGQQ